MSETTLESQWGFKGRLINVEVLTVELADGLRARREIVRHRGAVVVLARRPDGCFLLVRQFRKAVERNLLEVVAGTRDGQEDWSDCAARELAEETGYAAATLTPMGELVPAPGYTDEILHVYLAATASAPAAGAMPDVDERIEVVPMRAEAIDEAMARGEITDAKTLATWMLYTVRGRPLP